MKLSAGIWGRNLAESSSIIRMQIHGFQHPPGLSGPYHGRFGLSSGHVNATVLSELHDFFREMFRTIFQQLWVVSGTKLCILFVFSKISSYDETIKGTGRHFTDFLQNVDNIHIQFTLSYPKMKSPSMYLTEVDENGCVLVYRSGRQGFTHYLMGEFFNKLNEIVF